MKIERLRKIISYSEKNRTDINLLIKNFCSFTEMEYEKEVLNILQIVRSSFLKKGYLVFEMPFADHEIGALCYKGDGLGYVVINTSLPRVNVNFAAAHEIYHVYFQEKEFISKVEFAEDGGCDREEEYAANLFAGMLLMPETGFRKMFHKFRVESDEDTFATVMKLMAYYQVPYMSVLIRCYELNLLEKTGISNDLLEVSDEKIKEKFAELWLDDTILQASGKDDYVYIKDLVKKIGKEYMEDGYLHERTFMKVLQNMDNLYQKIKGE